MSSPFKAWIIPLEGGDAHPEHPIVIPPGQPPGFWGPTDPRPTPPIYWPGYPGGGGGGQQPPSGAHPEHPIFYPPGIWGPNDPRPTPPIYIPPGASDAHPAHPIVIPPASDAHPAHPIVIPDPPTEPPPGGGETGTPSQPIELPPTEAVGENGYWAQAYFPELNGWIWVWVPVPPGGEGKRKRG